MRRRRSRQRGQVIPIVALMLVVLTGFAALTIDAGVAYDQSRTQQDAADAASLAATKYVYEGRSNPNDTGYTLGGAYAAAQSVASMDCIGPSAPCPIAMNFYGSSWTASNPGTPLCSASTQTQANACNSVALGTVAYAGVSISGTGQRYLGGLDPVQNRTFSVKNQAVAQVVGGPGSSGDGDEYLSCVLCILAEQGGTGLTIPSGVQDLDMTTTGANIAINGGFSCASGDGVTIDTTGSGRGSSSGVVDIAGTGTYSDGCSATWDPSSNPVTGTQAIPDPLAAMIMPSATTYPASGCISETITTSMTLQPGCYGLITIDGTCTRNCGNDQQGAGCPSPANDAIEVTFASGLYIFYGDASSPGGLTIEGSATVSSEVCDSQDGGDTLDFVCEQNSAPAACTTPQAGAELNLNVNDSGYQWNLFPPTTGPQANMVVLYDRNNTSPIVTSPDSADPDSDHNGGIYALSSTYETENYCTSRTSQVPCPSSDNSGGGDATALGSPIVVDYMSLGTDYSGGDYGYGGGSPFKLNNDVMVPAGGTGGLVS